MTSVSTAPHEVAAELAALPPAAQAVLLDLYRIQAPMTLNERALAGSLVGGQGTAIAAFLSTAGVLEALPASELMSAVLSLLFVDVEEVIPDGD